MSWIKTVDKYFGISLRFLTDLVTGNSLPRMERRINAKVGSLEKSIRDASLGNKRLRDDIEQHMLDIYKKANRK